MLGGLVLGLGSGLFLLVLISLRFDRAASTFLLPVPSPAPASATDPIAPVVRERAPVAHLDSGEHSASEQGSEVQDSEWPLVEGPPAMEEPAPGPGLEETPSPTPTPIVLSSPPPAAPAPTPRPSPTATATPTTTGMSANAVAEATMLGLINNERANAGLPPLQIDARLREVARSHATEMVQMGYFGHVSPITGSPFDRLRQAGVRYSIAAENLASAPDVYLAHQGLMSSTAHWSNILRPEFRWTGIGVVGDKFVQLFTD